MGPVDSLALSSAKNGPTANQSNGVI